MQETRYHLAAPKWNVIGAEPRYSILISLVPQSIWMGAHARHGVVRGVNAANARFGQDLYDISGGRSGAASKNIGG